MLDLLIYLGIIVDCTIAIINAKDIPASYLHGAEPETFHDTAVATYLDIYESLLTVREDCLGEEKRVGWALAGKDEFVYFLSSGD